MKSSLALLVVVLLVLVVSTGCAPGPNQFKGTANEHDVLAGFWLGIWHGFIAPFVFVISLFKSNLSIYEAHNNGAWYNLGYLFGLCCFFGGGGRGSARRKQAPANTGRKALAPIFTTRQRETLSPFTSSEAFLGQAPATSLSPSTLGP